MDKKPSFFLMTLPALVRICKAFPPLCDDAVALLLQLGRMVHSHLSTLSISVDTGMLLLNVAKLIYTVFWNCYAEIALSVLPLAYLVETVLYIFVFKTLYVLLKYCVIFGLGPWNIDVYADDVNLAPGPECLVYYVCFEEIHALPLKFFANTRTVLRPNTQSKQFIRCLGHKG